MLSSTGEKQAVRASWAWEVWTAPPFKHDLEPQGRKKPVTAPLVNKGQRAGSVGLMGRHLLRDYQEIICSAEDPATAKWPRDCLFFCLFCFVIFVLSCFPNHRLVGFRRVHG